MLNPKRQWLVSLQHLEFVFILWFFILECILFSGMRVWFSASGHKGESETGGVARIKRVLEGREANER